MKILTALIPSVSDKVKTDSLWNILGFVTASINGLIILLIISKVYDSSVLGLFNLVYAIYILLSQLAGGGIHFSVLKHTAQYAGDQRKITTILNAGILLTLLVSTVIIGVVYLFKDLFRIFFDNPSGVDSMVLTLPALLFFTLNKVILFFHNACRRMKAYAIFYGLRSLLMTISLLVFIMLKARANTITAIFSFSEFTLFVILSIYSLRFFSFNLSAETRRWIKYHFFFGMKAMAGTCFVDINTRVDILVLGIFTSDKCVGIYSFAAMMIDGFNQLPFVFCKIINPIITDYKYNKGSQELRHMVLKARNLFYKYLSPLGILGVMVYPLLIFVLKLSPEYSKGWLPFAILMAGSLLSIGYAPFLMILNQTGFPGFQSLLYFLIFITNFLLNLVLIPFLGILGAALATGFSFVCLALYIRLLTHRALKIRI